MTDAEIKTELKWAREILEKTGAENAHLTHYGFWQIVPTCRAILHFTEWRDAKNELPETDIDVQILCDRGCRHIAWLADHDVKSKEGDDLGQCFVDESGNAYPVGEVECWLPLQPFAE